MSTPKTSNESQKPIAGRENAAPTNPNKEFGEGNYKATREYNQATRRFVESGKVDAAAEAAKPANDAEARELEKAEEAGRDKRRK